MYQGRWVDQMVILQYTTVNKQYVNGILREMVAHETVLASLQVDVACILETELLPKDKTPEIPQHRAFRHDRPIQGVKPSTSMYTMHWHSLLSIQLLERPTCWRN